jgi:hypothetical protein
MPPQLPRRPLGTALTGGIEVSGGRPAPLNLDGQGAIY